MNYANIGVEENCRYSAFLYMYNMVLLVIRQQQSKHKMRFNSLRPTDAPLGQWMVQLNSDRPHHLGASSVSVYHYVFDQRTHNSSNAENPWWRTQMETFSVLLDLCARISPVTGEFPSQRPVTWRIDIFFDLRLNKRLSKQSRRRWFETPSLLCPCNALLECPYAVASSSVTPSKRRLFISSWKVWFLHI